MSGCRLSHISLIPVVAIDHLLSNLYAGFPACRSESGKQLPVQIWHTSVMYMQTWGADCAPGSGNSNVSWLFCAQLPEKVRGGMERQENWWIHFIPK